MRLTRGTATRRLHPRISWVIAVLLLPVLAVPAEAFVLPASGFYAYRPSFPGGVHVAAGNLDGDPEDEIVTGAGAGGGPHVRVFDADGTPLAGWYAYDPAFRGGVYVAVGNVDTDPMEEVVTGAGAGGGSHVIVWDMTTGSPQVQGSTIAYGGFSGGVRVATGDVDGTDGRDEIITGAGPGGGPHVKVLDTDGFGLPALTGAFVYSSGFRGGVWVGAGDTDGDGRDEVITGAGPGGSPHVRVFDSESGLVPRAGFLAYGPGFTGGVRVAAVDVNGDTSDEVLTGAGPGGGPHVRVVTESGSGIEGFYAYTPTFTGGVFVAGRDEVVTGAGATGGPHVRVFEFPRDPNLTVTTFVGSSDVGRAWDIAFLPGGQLLWTEFFTGELKMRAGPGSISTLATVPNLFTDSETGLMGLTVDPQFESNRRIYICRGWTNGPATDIRVEAWQIAVDLSSASPVAGDPVLVSGIPVSTGRHAGCRLLVDLDGNLRITTGDAAIGTTPQNLMSLGGKTLRVNRFSGAAAAGNPFVGTPGADPRVFTYGHRNPQGLARRPGTSQYFTAEHGPDRDDEVNMQQGGGNYGWDPVPGYNESVPMTDLGKFPTAIPATWSSGFPTTAASGITFVMGSQWQGWDGALIIANLKGRKLITLILDGAGRVVHQAEALQGDDRLRSAVVGPDGNLYLTTSNDSGNRIMRVVPS